MTKEEIGQVVLDVHREWLNNHSLLTEAQIGLWQHIGITLYNAGLEAAVEVVGQYGYDVDEDRICRDIRSLKVQP